MIIEFVWATDVCFEMSSAQRQLLMLVSLSFLFAMMISWSGFGSRSFIVSWSPTTVPSDHSITLTEAEKQALTRYFMKYVIMKRQRLSTKSSAAPDSIKSNEIKREAQTMPPFADHPQVPMVKATNNDNPGLSSSRLLYTSVSTVSKALTNASARIDSEPDNDIESINHLRLNSSLVEQFKSKLKQASLQSRSQQSMITMNEVKTSMHYVSNKSDVCWHNQGSGLSLLVMVITSPINLDARQSIRRTWGGLAVERGAKLLFVIGRPAIDGPVNVGQTLSQLIAQEDEAYNDILQGNFVDSYDNLTLKSISILNWVAEHCRQVKYVFKVDDDMFINMQMLVDFAETSNYRNVLIGKIAKKWAPHRNRASKYFVSYGEFNQTLYPNFATGPAYMITGDAVPALLHQLDSGVPVMRLEDVFVTGVLAERASVRRLNYFFFKNVYFKVNQCNFGKFITSHHHSPNQIEQLWRQVYRVPPDDCRKNSTVKSPSPAVPFASSSLSKPTGNSSSILPHHS